VAIEVGEAGFWWRWTHRRRPAVGAEALIGRPAEVVEECRPGGKVRVAGELWAARCPEGAEVGDAIQVVDIDGLTLLVARR
jgi:membrane-bound serine protease (ClpP class)